MAATLTNLACAEGALGDACKVKELPHRALGIKERHFGREHVEVARTLFDRSRRRRGPGSPPAGEVPPASAASAMRGERRRAPPEGPGARRARDQGAREPWRCARRGPLPGGLASSGAPLAGGAARAAHGSSLGFGRHRRLG